MRRRRLILRLALASFFLASCTPSELPEPAGREPSVALAETEGTFLHRALMPPLGAHRGQSGFTLLSDGAEALSARADLLALAEKSIDAQYYIWQADVSGRWLAYQLLTAADRGVRVRLLLDDLGKDISDEIVTALDAHPGVEVRLFNPSANEVPRGLQLLMDFDQLNHRMHNKALIIDNTAAVVGGRNIGDEYFGLKGAMNFRDLDLLAVGPVVHDVSASFDHFWNSSWAWPVPAVTGDRPGPAVAEHLAAALKPGERELELLPPVATGPREAAEARLSALDDSLRWGKAFVIYDDPAKVADAAGSTVIRSLAEGFAATDHRVLMEIAYFVPLRAGVEALAKLTERGVAVSLLTNSLATNDVAAAHAGYAEYRRGLLENGVEVFEFRPDAEAPRPGWSLLAGDSQASVHTKALVLDDVVFVGSFNLDPRSVSINTEMGIAVASAALAADVGRFIRDGMQPANAWKVELVPRPDGIGTLIRWTGAGDHGQAVHHWHEPETSLWRRMSAWLMKWLPIESQL